MKFTEICSYDRIVYQHIVTFIHQCLYERSENNNIRMVWIHVKVIKVISLWGALLSCGHIIGIWWIRVTGSPILVKVARCLCGNHPNASEVIQTHLPSGDTTQ